MRNETQTRKDETMRSDWNTIVKWTNGESVREIIVAANQDAACRAARSLAKQRRPHNGSAVSITATARN